MNDDKTKEIADMICGIVLDNMAIVMTRRTAQTISRTQVRKMIECGQFPDLIADYEKQVNDVCDNLVGKS